MTKLIHMTAALLSLILISSCSPNTQEVTNPPSSPNDWPSITSVIKCLAPSGPIIAVHRGRDKSTKDPENSLAGLKTVRQSGYILAEIDIAQLRDKTLIAFHDGVWDDLSTGKGPISKTTWADAEKLLLKTRKGGLTNQRPARFDNILNWANRQFYFEIDIKSSANEALVVRQIYAAGMAEHVILISYNDAQYARLLQLSKTIAKKPMMISIRAKPNLTSDNNPILAWTGSDEFDASMVDRLSARDIPTAYGLFSPKYAPKAAYWKTNILVTDYPAEAKALARVQTPDVDRIKGCS